MESGRFDGLVRALTIAPSRRALAHILSAGVLAAGWSGATNLATEAKAKKKRKKKKKTCKPQCDKECQICNVQKGTCKSVDDGTPCTSGDICEDGECVAFRCGNGGPCTAFVTNASKAGSAIGGLLGGDAFCQSAAEDAGLSGAFQAWLAGDVSPADRFTNREKAGPYVLVPNAADGNNPPPTVAADFADLTSCNGDEQCLQHPINRTEDGLVLEGGIGVWTGTLTNGESDPATCAGFTSGGSGLFGSGTSVDRFWTENGETGCGTEFHLYCFEQA